MRTAFSLLLILAACGPVQQGNCTATTGTPAPQSPTLDCPPGSVLTRVDGGTAWCAPLIVNCPSASNS